MKININIPKKRILDMFATAIESNKAIYWAQVEWPPGTADKIFKYVCHPQMFIDIAILDENGNTSDVRRLTQAGICQGFQLLAEKYPHHFADFLDEREDAITADIWLQLCLFGEIAFA